MISVESHLYDAYDGGSDKDDDDEEEEQDDDDDDDDDDDVNKKDCQDKDGCYDGDIDVD